MDYERIVDSARKKKKASLVLKGGRLVNVYDRTIRTADIAIEDGRIAGFGDYEGEQEVDLKGSFVAPGFIDGHVHIESSMVTPPEFARLVLPKGTTTVIADPHEIANVLGLPGIRFMLDASENIPLGVHVMLPSCVPATVHEKSGAVLRSDDLSALKDHPRVLGLGEVMDYVAVINNDPEIRKKIDLMPGRMVDGHAPDLVGDDLSAYIAAGVMTDHECTRVESLKERVAKGMYVHLREGSQTRNTQALLPGVSKDNSDRLLFCTDDKHPEDIVKEGHINYNVNLAIAHGIDPVDAIRMATLNAATCYGLQDIGGIAPGKRADLIVFDSLERIEPDRVYKDGVLVARKGKALFEAHFDVPASLTDTVRFAEVDLSLRLKSDRVRVIGLVENNITTEALIRTVETKDGYFVPDPEQDILKIAVIERHHMTKKIGIGLVEGFGFTGGALAMTISHDSHNLVVIGSADSDMELAMSRIKTIKGGIVIVRNGAVASELPLEVGGIMTNRDGMDVQRELRAMKRELASMGLSERVADPFISLAFLCLPVIPKLKLTVDGLFDVEPFEHVPIEGDRP
ncbi:MAG: adenine deaminase [Acholeplasmataceae bacterium]